MRFLTLVILCLSIAACNTIGGLGRDLSETGKAVDEMAGWSQDQLNDVSSETSSTNGEEIYQFSN